MRLAALSSCLLLAAVPPSGSVLELISPELRSVAQRRATIERELASLGAPVVGQTVEQFGYQHPRLDAPPLNPAWVQIDLGAPQPLDWIALVPAQLEWQSLERNAYGFPKRFRVDVADNPEFHAPIAVADFTESDFPEPGVAPVGMRVAQTARYLRITVTKFALENGQYFFALSEVMALSGNRNVANGKPVSVSNPYGVEQRWTAANLTDGRSPLGPPIRKELIAYDGLFADATPKGGPPFAQIDLGEVRRLQEVRLHPVHARIGADVPGFLFPKRFRVEAATAADFSDAALLYSSDDFPNPGNNPVTLDALGTAARFVRVLVPKGAAPVQPRFGLSELEVYADGTNIARGRSASRTPDRSKLSSGWPDSVLTDGFTSYGRISELPVWLEAWERRRGAEANLAALDLEEPAARRVAERRAWRLVAVTLVALIATGVVWNVRARNRRRREIEALRFRIARDLHDEIGSNLASLAVTGEVAGAAAGPAQREDWQEVQRVSRESMDSMREVLWVLGAREEEGLDLLARLERTAQRMLARHEFEWIAPPENPPAGWTPEMRREAFLFFKEALANIVRHARARRVLLHAAADSAGYLIEIRDDGCGFDPDAPHGGIGLKSLRERARALRGRLLIDSSRERGTRLSLRIPF